ncbi:MAG: GNAT family N-acetyltransferase [Clostridiales bacterium]|nr:GNAT family N-acetyltransferase [Clostridiales bacterium]
MFNFIKDYKARYKPSGIPREIEDDVGVYLVYEGGGFLSISNPEYVRAKKMLRKLAKTIKLLANTCSGYFDYAMPPFSLLIANPQKEYNLIKGWTLLMRQPEFISDEVFRLAKSAIGEDKNDKITLQTYNQGLSVHCMHIGEVKYIHQTYKMLDNYLAEHGLIKNNENDRKTKIILLKTDYKNPEKTKIIISIPVRRGSNNDCPCTMSCSRHGKCEECIAYHTTIKSSPYCSRRLKIKFSPIREATMEDKEAMNELYKSLYGTTGCTWSKDYPSMEVIEYDISRNSTFVLESGKEIVAAISIEKESDFLRAEIWSEVVKNPCGMGRLAVRRDMQGRGLAKKMMFHAIAKIKELGHDSAVLLVCSKNKVAKRLYKTYGFDFRGKVDMYDYIWDAYEKIL